MKARLATLDDVVADALQGDLGLTSRLRPTELPNPDGLADDLLPGVDLGDTELAAVVAYTRLLDIPERSVPDARGVALSSRWAARCATCQVSDPDGLADTSARRGRRAGVQRRPASRHGPSSRTVRRRRAPGRASSGPLRSSAFATCPATFTMAGRRRSGTPCWDTGGPESEANEVIGRFSELAAAEQDALLGFVAGL